MERIYKFKEGTKDENLALGNRDGAHMLMKMELFSISYISSQQ